MGQRRQPSRMLLQRGIFHTKYVQYHAGRQPGNRLQGNLVHLNTKFLEAEAKRWLPYGGGRS